MTTPRHTLLAAAILLISATAVQAQQAYPSPDRAAQALVDAISSNNQAALQKLLGKNWRHYLPTAGLDKQEVDKFLADWRTAHRIEQQGNTAHLSVGKHNWILPMPIRQVAKGWAFDLPAAAEEIRVRTIGRNELSAIQAAMAYVDAQRDYYTTAHTGEHSHVYAQKLISSPGKQDGLYWPAANGAPASPLGPAFGNTVVPGSDYHGYYYRILTAQGPQAHSGAYSYINNGEMNKGFALIAWPASYGNSGVTSFIINQDGVIYQKDLGNGTDKIARGIKSFNPGTGWQKVPDTQSAVN